MSIEAIPTPVKRIITCQGSIQLVTALSVVFQYEQQSNSQCYENYLVIYGLYAPGDQDREFVAFITKMAQQLCNWRAIAYLNPKTLQTISDQLNVTAPTKLFNTVHQLVGTETADELYLCRNWQFSNQLLLNTYPLATKICYGDSIGIYFSAQSSVVPSATNLVEGNLPRPTSFIRNWLSLCRLNLGKLRETIRERFQPKTILQSIEFDVGYFLLPEIFGEVPPMPVVQADLTMMVNLFQTLGAIANPEYITQFQAKIAGAPISILLTSNLSEAERMTQDDEISAYRQFLISCGISSNSVLVIKPHPRDDISKLYALKDALADLFSQVLILSEPELFFLPFEVFFLAAFPQILSETKTDITVFAVSSACLSLKLLFNVSSFIGFGHELTSRYFNPAYCAARLEHEQVLVQALQQLARSYPEVQT